MNSYSRLEPEIKAQGPLFHVPLVVVILLAALVLVHVAIQLGGEDWRIWSLAIFAFIPARITGELVIAGAAGAKAWSFVSYAFLHSGWEHLIFNSLWLVVFGTITARRLRSLRFLLLALISTIAGAAIMLLAYWGEDTIVIGASAAVSGMMGAAIPIMFGRRMNVQIPVGPPQVFLEPLRLKELFTDRRALFFMIFAVVIAILPAFGGITSNDFVQDEALAWQAHLAGLVVGLLCFYWFDGIGALPKQIK